MYNLVPGLGINRFAFGRVVCISAQRTWDTTVCVQPFACPIVLGAGLQDGSSQECGLHRRDGWQLDTNFEDVVPGSPGTAPTLIAVPLAMPDAAGMLGWELVAPQVSQKQATER